MSRWVRCSYGKRAGFVGAKIDIISEYTKFFENFLRKNMENGSHYRVKFHFMKLNSAQKP